RVEGDAQLDPSGASAEAEEEGGLLAPQELRRESFFREPPQEGFAESVRSFVVRVAFPDEDVRGVPPPVSAIIGRGEPSEPGEFRGNLARRLPRQMDPLGAFLPGDAGRLQARLEYLGPCGGRDGLADIRVAW